MFEGGWPSFGREQVLPPGDTGVRTFDRHYLLYAASGAFHLESGGAQWVLPPQRAALIEAEVPIRVKMLAPVTCRSVLFAPSLLTCPHPCRVFEVSPLVKEMVRYAMRWGPEEPRPHQDDAETFFRALAAVCAEQVSHPDRFWLPGARSEDLRRAMDFTLLHLDRDLTLDEVADRAAASTRTLARRFADEAGLSWKQFRHRARMLRAMETLSQGGANVGQAAMASGYDSPSAFVRAFRDFSGQTPSQYRRQFYAAGDDPS